MTKGDLFEGIRERAIKALRELGGELKSEDGGCTRDLAVLIGEERSRVSDALKKLYLDGTIVREGSLRRIYAMRLVEDPKARVAGVLPKPAAKPILEPIAPKAAESPEAGVPTPPESTGNTHSLAGRVSVESAPIEDDDDIDLTVVAWRALDLIDMMVAKLAEAPQFKDDPKVLQRLDEYRRDRQRLSEKVDRQHDEIVGLTRKKQDLERQLHTALQNNQRLMSGAARPAADDRGFRALERMVTERPPGYRKGPD